MAWQQTPSGYYPGQPVPPQPGYYPGGAYPQQQQSGSYPPQQTSAPPLSFGGFAPSHVPPTGQNMHSSYQEDPINGANFSFSEKTIRMAFIRKVYAILMCQLAVTLAFGSLFVAHAPTKNYVLTHPGLWWIAFIVMIVTLLTMGCCGDVRRTAPANYIFLFLFTIAESFLVGCTVSVHRVDAVIYAVGICTVVCLGLTVFAFQTKVDFTMLGGILFAAVLILFVFGILLLFFPGKTGVLVYASIGAFIFSLYIIYDTQLMIGGDHKYSISPEEYIFAALNLYIDIITLFLHILTIISASRD